MSDFESFRREAGNEVVPPDFDELVATSRRRRRTAAGSAVVAVAAVVSVVAFGLQGVYGDQTAPVPPVGPTRSPTPTPNPTPTPSPTKDTSPSPEERPDRLTPTQIVNDENSTISDVAVSAGSPEVRAVIWQFCGEGGGCNHQQFALTVTGDGFKTSHDIALPGRVVKVVAAGANSFFVTFGRSMSLVDSDGSVSAIQLDKKASPLVAGEVFVGGGVQGPIGYPHLALNPATAMAHPVSEPPHNGTLMLERNTNGTLVGVVYDWQAGTQSRSVIWSRDGGASWNKRLLVEGSDLVSVIPSASVDDVMAVVQGGDGATLFPFDKVHRSVDGGAAWETIDESQGDMAYLGWSLVAPDGSLLVNIEAWSDARHNRPSAQPAGIYESNGGDWSDLRFVQPPDGSQPEGSVSDLALGDYASTDSGVLRLWIYDSTGGRLFESGPGIHTWAEVPAR